MAALAGLSFEGRNEGLSLLLGELPANGIEKPVEFRSLERNALLRLHMPKARSRTIGATGPTSSSLRVF